MPFDPMCLVVDDFDQLVPSRHVELLIFVEHLPKQTTSIPFYCFRLVPHDVFDVLANRPIL